MLVAGDVGGTKTRLGLFQVGPGRSLALVHTKRFDSASYPSLASIVHAFYEESKITPDQVDRACFGVPGPVIKGHVKVTNLPWTMSEVELSKELGIARVRLVNDLVSTAAAAPQMKADSLATIYPGNDTEAVGAQLVVAPGTGLGHAIIHVAYDGTLHFLASEGGHANLAPNSDQQCDLMRYLAKKLGHASVESVLSGPGIFNIYSFLRDSGRYTVNKEITLEFDKADDAQVITAHALNRTDDLCEATMTLFVELLGAHTSNVMLSVLATGGVFLGGGIPPKIVPLLERGEFQAAYLKKGKCLDKVQATPVKVILDDRASLLGAAEIAQGL